MVQGSHDGPVSTFRGEHLERRENMIGVDGAPFIISYGSIDSFDITR